MIDLFRPYVPKDVCEAVTDTLRGKCITQGPKVDEFEKQFCNKFSASNVVSVNSGTSALELAYELLDLKPGDEVITTPFTCTATNIPLLRLGVKIVWADILRSTLCINPIDVRTKVTERTKAIVQVHVGGLKADIGFIHTSGDTSKKIPVVSDSAQALGIFNGDFTCCSFQAIKHVTTVDGGMLICPNQELSDRAKLLRWFGIDRNKRVLNNAQNYKIRKMTFDIDLPGTKRHMNDVDASMGIAGLQHYDEIIDHRRKLFNIYGKAFSKLDGIELVGASNSNQNTYWLATVLVDRRDDFAKMLFENDIDCNVVQVRNDLYKIFGGKRADLPMMNSIEDKYLSIPIGMHVSEDDAHFICNCVKNGW